MQFASRLGVGNHAAIPIIFVPRMQQRLQFAPLLRQLSWSMAALISETVYMVANLNPKQRNRQIHPSQFLREIFVL